MKLVVARWSWESFVTLSALTATLSWSSWAEGDALTDYAAACDSMTGTHVGDFTCSAGSIVPTTNMVRAANEGGGAIATPGPGDYRSTRTALLAAFSGSLPTAVDVKFGAEAGTPQMIAAKAAIPTCDQPNRLNAECDPGTRFQVLHRNDSDGAYIFALCRPKGAAAGFYRDIGVIQTNTKSGATCFYSSTLGGGDLSDQVLAPSKGLGAGGWGSWMTPTAVANEQCHGCHDNGAMIRTPFLTQLRPDTDVNALPGVGNPRPPFNRAESPYRFVGDAFQNWTTWEVEVQGGECTSCHRIGINNGTVRDYRHGGAALNFGMWATSAFFVQTPSGPASSYAYELAKSPNVGPWMPPGGEPDDMFIPAMFYEGCAEAFENPILPMPSDCSFRKSSASNLDCDPTLGECNSGASCNPAHPELCFDTPPASSNYRTMIEAMMFPRTPTPQEYVNGFANLSAGISQADLLRDQNQPRVPSLPGGITVDGLLDETAWASSPIKTLIQTVEGASAPIEDSSAGFRATWDSRNLYFFVRVIDDVRRADNGAGEYYKDDSVEIYIDGRDRRNPSYGSGQEFQLVFRCAEGGVLVKELGANSAALALAQVTASCKDHPGDKGYDVEVSLPWATMNVPPGQRMAVEVHVNDDDVVADSGRDSQQAWRTTSSHAWEDPRLMTAVDLADEIRSTATPVTLGSFGANAAWASATWRELKNKPLGADTSTDTASWKATFDSNKLYLWVAVNDNDPRAPNSPQAYDDDSVEIYLDADNSKNWSGYGALDAQILVRRSAGCGAVEFGANGLQSAPGITRCVQTRTGGYDVEVGIPWSAVGGFPGTGARVGLDVQVNDDDGPSAARDYKRSWFAKDDQAWNQPSIFGSVRLMGLTSVATPIAAKTTGSFTLDGVNTGGEWNSFTSRGIDTLVSGSASTGATWRAAWGGEYLYVFVQVPDASIRRDSAQWWNDDSIELFFDSDRSRGTTMDHVNDRQLVFRALDADTAQAGPNSQPFANMVVRWATTTSPAGYSAEIRVPWREVSLFGEAGNGFGFDVQVNDDDQGGNRTGKRAWKATSDNTWQNPSLMAPVGLAP